MEDFSEQNIKENCPHCDQNSFAFKCPLKETSNFLVVCDVHPISKGHILIIPKAHLSCIGEYPEEIYEEFLDLYKEISTFLLHEYGAVSSFEHGKISQTVFHSHVHFVPFDGDPLIIVPEGNDKLTTLNDLHELKTIFEKDRAYLFFSIGQKYWIVDINIAAPRFFRDRFAKAFGNAERGNWKEMRVNEQLMEKANKDIVELEEKWHNYKVA